MRVLIAALLFAIGIAAVTVAVGTPQAFAEPTGKKCTEPC